MFDFEGLCAQEVINTGHLVEPLKFRINRISKQQKCANPQAATLKKRRTKKFKNKNISLSRIFS